jgi:hypothetical protein
MGITHEVLGVETCKVACATVAPHDCLILLEDAGKHAAGPVSFPLADLAHRGEIHGESTGAFVHE